jgi:hypothetical protein
VDQKAQDKKQDCEPYRAMYQELTADNMILQTAWKDNALVLMMSTVHELSTPENSVLRLRKRLAASSTSAKTARAAFHGKDRINMLIPNLVDDYNHNMNGVDQSDQLRANHPGTCRVRRGGWHALWLFMFNVVLCNSYLLSSIKSQDEFRKLLYKRLFQVGASTRKRKWEDLGPEIPLFQQTLNPDSGDAVEEPALEHRRVHLSQKEECQGCCLTGQSRAPTKRRILGEISLNTRNNSQPKRSYYGCLACDVALCKEGPCFEQFHEKYVNYADLDQSIDVGYNDTE